MKTHWLFLLVLLCGCESRNTTESISDSESSTPGTIVLLFDNPPNNGVYQPVKDGPFMAAKTDVSYIQDDFTERKVELNHDAERDTLIIHTTRQQVEVLHFFRAAGRIPFLITKGDTVLFKYDGYLPMATVLNRPQEAGMNFPVRVRQEVFQDFFSSQEKIRGLPLFINTDVPDFRLEEQIPIQEHQFLQILDSELQQEKAMLDSAYSRGSISERYYDFFSADLLARDNSFALRLMEEGTPARMLDFGKVESPIYFASYRNILQEYVRTRVLPSVPKIKQKNGVLFDEREVFDKLAASPLFTGVDRDWLLFTSLRKIILNFSIEDGKKYISKFDSTSNGYFSSSTLISEFRLDQEVSDRLTLLRETGVETELSDILQANEGKVLYVDFWASWCRPCVEAFPEAGKLREKYADKEVVFIYFSIDDQEEAWKSALNRYDLGENSFLIQNRYTSTFLQDLTLETIPRYLIYNKSGKLVHRNAPGPTGTAIHDLLDELLAE